MMLTTLVMMMFEVKDNVEGLFVSLLGLYGVMGIHLHISLVDLDWGYEQGPLDVLI